MESLWNCRRNITWVRTDLEGETFRVTVGLVAAFNDGQISYDQLEECGTDRRIL